jgi:hypothetical protein
MPVLTTNVIFCHLKKRTILGSIKFEQHTLTSYKLLSRHQFIIFSFFPFNFDPRSADHPALFTEHRDPAGDDPADEE